MSIFNILLEWGEIRKHHGFREMMYKGEEIRFRESEWEERMQDEEFKKHVMGIVADRMVIKFKKYEK